MSATYNNLQFKTRLEAHWAAFFDLAGWEWHYNPVAIQDWLPDFRVKFDCSHSECGGHHTLLVSILPCLKVDDLKNHPCHKHSYGTDIPADSGAAFGITPDVTLWEMAHGAGGGVESVSGWVPNSSELWSEAGKLISTANEEIRY